MSVGLYLKAKLAKPRLAFRRKDPAQVLAAMKSWVLEYAFQLRPTASIGQSFEGKPTLFFNLHPAAEDVEITFIADDAFTATARTSTVGPGYHLYICDLLHALGSRFHAEWEPEGEDYGDEAHYFFTGKSQQVFAEMQTWLQFLARSFFDGTLDQDGPVRICLPLQVGYSWDDFALTPTGPRSLEWLRKVADNPNSGTQFFSWWSPGFSADYFFGRALARIWADVRWRQPFNDSERSLLSEVDTCLKRAYGLDSELQYPWPEWAEVLRLLDRRGVDEEFVFERAGGRPARLGYRRRDVVVQLPGNWWIKVPGSFTEFMPEEDDALHAWDTSRGVFFTAYRFEDPKSSRAHWRSEMKKLPQELYIENERWVATAGIKKHSEEAKEYFALTSSNIGDEGRCVCTVVFEDERDRDWAIGVWKSLEPAPARKG